MTLRRNEASAYPYPDGDVTVLGPEIFVSSDESVICWKGRNYVPQNEQDEQEQALGGEAA